MNYADYITPHSTPIYLFHGVITRHHHPIRNYGRKHIDKDHFYNTLLSLKKRGTAVRLEDCLTPGDNPTFRPPSKNSFVVTFDDGFKNNLEIAVPILEELGIPALFYMTSQFIDENVQSWLDEIESAFEVSPRVKLTTPFDELNSSASTITDKIELLTRLRKIIKRDAKINPYEFSNDIVKQLGFEKAPWDPELDEKLNWEGVQKISNHPLFSIGGHGHTHRILSHLSAEDLDYEISHSLELLQTKGQIQTRHFCYPDGQTFCYSNAVIKTLKSHGIVCSPTAELGENQTGADLFHLKRIMVV